MTITTLPAAADIRTDSRLRPEQVSTALADTTALDADITTRITTYEPVINNKIAGVTTSAAYQIIATRALFLRVESSLYGSAGQLNGVYWDRAKELKAESDELISDLIAADAIASGDTIAGVAGTGNAATLSTAPYFLNDELLVVNA